ncbi:DUF1648 domain-containing protein [Prescottella sp. R16]|uniref:DUF1648 domain-containing protein n=1 Tax=Prescottella sp. R16 TaxID=3064529 RepID=UPI00272EB128|nr:DUF1648 domain-containing protein [Prescottella sp. R16]
MTDSVVVQKVSWVRSGVAAVSLPVVAAVIGVVVLGAWSAELPDPVAVHFGSGGVADGFTGAGSVRWWPLFGPLFALLLAGVIAVCTRRDVRAGRFGAAVASGTGTALAALPVVLLAPQRGLADAADASIGLQWALVAVVLGIAAGCAALPMVGRVMPVRAAAPPPANASRLDIADTEAVVWTGSAALPRWAAIGLAALPMVLALAVSRTVGPELLVTGVVGALLLGVTLAPVHVVVDGRGLETRYVLTGGRRRIPLDEIARADAVKIGLINRYGGIGYRVGPDGVGLLVRPGAALRITRGDGSKFTVTVDDADQAAAVLNSLAARGRIAR